MDPVSHDPIRIAEQDIYRVRHSEGVDLARPDDHKRLALTEAARAQEAPHLVVRTGGPDDRVGDAMPVGKKEGVCHLE